MINSLGWDLCPGPSSPLTLGKNRCMLLMPQPPSQNSGDTAAKIFFLEYIKTFQAILLPFASYITAWDENNRHD